MLDTSPGGIISPQTKPDNNQAKKSDEQTLVSTDKTPINDPKSVDQSQKSDTTIQPVEPSKSFYSEIEEKNDFSEKALEPVSWTASEYISHPKSISWYFVLAAATLVFTAGIFFVTHGDIISSLAVLVLAVIFGVYAARQPKEQSYLLDQDGLHIGTRIYGFGSFKSFSILDEGPFSSIVLMPLKRFMPLISIYYDPAEEEKIVGFLSEHLAIEYRQHDFVDKFMRKIKF